MTRHRNTQPNVSNNPPASKFSPIDALEKLFVEMIEVEALAYAAGEAVTEVGATASNKRVINRLYTLVTRTASSATAALAVGEKLMSALNAHLARVAAEREAEGQAGS